MLHVVSIMLFSFVTETSKELTQEDGVKELPADKGNDDGGGNAEMGSRSLA